MPLRGFYERLFTSVRNRRWFSVVDREKTVSLVIIDTPMLLRTYFQHLKCKLY